MGALPAIMIDTKEVVETAQRSMMLSVNDFSLSFRDRSVLSKINLQIPTGQFVALIGPSGSGKSTLLNAIAGFIAATTPGVATRGEILVGDSPPGHHSVRCGVVFQEYALFPWRTARRNVEFALEALNVPVADRERRSMQYLQQVGLAASATLYPHQLSGGHEAACCYRARSRRWSPACFSWTSRLALSMRSLGAS